MPYIQQDKRPRIDRTLKPVLDSDICQDYITNGELNYFLSSIIWTIFEDNPSYTHANDLIGVLECVKQEFIRRKLNPLEDKKMIENGDIC